MKLANCISTVQHRPKLRHFLEKAKKVLVPTKKNMKLATCIPTVKTGQNGGIVTGKEPGQVIVVPPHKGKDLLAVAPWTIGNRMEGHAPLNVNYKKSQSYCHVMTNFFHSH